MKRTKIWVMGVMVIAIAACIDEAESKRVPKMSAPEPPAATLGQATEVGPEVSLNGDRLPPLDGELKLNSQAELAQLDLPNGSVLHFIEFEPGNIAVLEEQAAGVASISTVEGMPDNPSVADVFHAFSEAGRDIPAAIVDASELSSDTGAQGWARELLNHSVVVRGNCTDSTFSNWIQSFGYNDRGTPDLRLNQKPESSGYFKAYDYKPGNGKSYDFYRYEVGGNQGSIWYNVDRYVTRVAVCAIDTIADGNTTNPGGLAHPPISYQGYNNNHMGPTVWFLYRGPGETTWKTASSKDFGVGDVGKAVSWHFYTGANWDWQTKIYWAGGDDKFDIGHAVEDLGF